MALAGSLKKRLSLRIYEGLLSVVGLALVCVFFAWGEEYRVLVAGTATDSVVVTVTVSDIISISTPSDVNMAPDIFGTGVSTGEVLWTVETNNDDGWKLEVHSSSDPAMRLAGVADFADYTETVAGVPETWSVASSDSEFGFSADGSYALSQYSSGTFFEGFAGLNKIKVAEDSAATPGGGADTTVKFRAEVGSNKNQPSGCYTATIVATASTL